MYQEDFNEDNPITSNDFSVEDLKRNLNETNLVLLETLKGRYMQELIGSMVFFIFNEICQNKVQNEDTINKDNTVAKIFFSSWLDNAKKRSKKEILEINNKLKDNKMNFLGAISNYSLPSTEDYQEIYNKALSEVQKVFQKNTEV
jgi:hypothetical protein